MFVQAPGVDVLRAGERLVAVEVDGDWVRTESPEVRAGQMIWLSVKAFCSPPFSKPYAELWIYHGG